jgi:hypothetical protein
MRFRHRSALIAACIVQVFCGRSLRCQTSVEERTKISLERLPIEFEENQGQVGLRAQFVARSGRLYLEMLPAEIDLSLASARKRETLRLELVNGDPKARIAPLGQTESVTNYFPSRNPSSWHVHIPNFRQVRYSDIYPGIDVLFYGSGTHLEHDFIVAPFADYRKIRMRAAGAREISVQPDGSLKIALANGNLIFHSPDVYQTLKPGREYRRGRFTLLARNEIGFAIGEYDHSKPLVIDPVLSYETFLTNSPFYTFGVATDVSGNTYVSGAASDGAVGVLKLNATGTGLLYASYFGDSCQPFGGIAVDSNGDAIVAVAMLSANVPLKNPVEAPFFTGNGSWYAYVFSLSPDGSSQNYASLLGGGAQVDQSSTTYINGVAVDPGGNAYVTGITNSPAFPVTPGALNNNNGEPADSNNIAYVTKFLPNGNLGYSALLNNGSTQNGGGAVSAIVVDSMGSAYVTGSADALWPITSNAYQNQIPGDFNPNTAPFVTKLSVDGSALVYSTFLGTQAQPTAITVNTNGEVFVAGKGAPTTFPTTSNAYQPTQVSNQLIASFISELSADGTQLLYSTFIHGLGQSGGGSSVTTITFDASGNLWLGGTTNEFDFPMVHPLQSVPATNNFTLPGFLARLDNHLARLTFSTFLGDLSQGAQSISISVDGGGRVHVAGVNGSEMYTTPGAYIASVPAPPQGVDYLYGFSAAIDPSVQTPAICVPLIPGPVPPTATIFGIAFGGIGVGTTSTQKIVITNCGELPLQISGEQSSDPAYTFPPPSTAMIFDFRQFGAWINLVFVLVCCLLVATGWTQEGWRRRFALTVLLAVCLGCGGGGGNSQLPPGPTGGVETCNQTVAVNGSCSLSVSFTPTAAKPYPAMLTITSNSSMPTFLPLSGTGE